MAQQDFDLLVDYMWPKSWHLAVTFIHRQVYPAIQTGRYFSPAFFCLPKNIEQLSLLEKYPDEPTYIMCSAERFEVVHYLVAGTIEPFLGYGIACFFFACLGPFCHPFVTHFSSRKKGSPKSFNGLATISPSFQLSKHLGMVGSNQTRMVGSFCGLLAGNTPFGCF